MSAYAKDHNDNNLCKKHTSRCDKDYRSVCPSKLSKSELEDLYYSLLENNLELKRTINAHSEKNRILSTKVQRMTALTKTYGGKDCCRAGKAVANEQKAVIADLRQANEAMADRIRKLSTQLCTARQFLKQNPNARHCYKCYVNATMSVKNLSTTTLHNKTSDANLKSVTSAIFPERPPPTTRTTGTITPKNEVENDEKDEDDKENKCEATVEDLKQRIKELEEELSKTQKDHYSSVAQLETQLKQVSQQQADAVRARSEQDFRARAQDDARLLEHRLRDIGADNTELETQLSIEKKKVAELEMRLKAAELSHQVARAIEEHLTTATRLEEKQLRQTNATRCSVCSNWVPEDISPRPMPSTPMSKRPNELTVPDDKLSKSDDSGFVDHRRESDSNDKRTNMINQELIKRIAEMQAQLDALQTSSTQNFTNYGKESDDDKVLRNTKILTKNPEILVSQPSVELSEHTVRNSLVVSRLELPENYQSTPLKGSRYNNEPQNKPDKLNVLKEHSKYLSPRNHENDKFDLDIETPDLNHSTAELDETTVTEVTERDSQSKNGNNNKENESNGNSTKQSHDKTRPRNSQEELITRERSYIRLTSEPSNIKSDNHVSKQIPEPVPADNNPETNKQPFNKKRANQNWKKVKKYGKRNDVVEEINKNIGTAQTGTKTGHDDKKVNRNQNKKTNYGKNYVALIDNDEVQTQTDGNHKIEDQKKIEHQNENRINNQNMIDSSIHNREENQTRETFEFTISSNVPNENKDQPKIRDYDSRTYELKGSANKRRSKVAEFDSVLKEPPIGTSTPKAEHRPTLRSHTYTVNSDNSRPTSPDNTDNEISGMTDLPTERELSTPRDVLSPGEQKMTGTSTTPTYSFYNDITLSEGEVPTGKYSRRRVSKSLGEVQSMDYPKEDESIGEAKRSSADKMDAALLDISQELARCRALMRHQRPRNLTYGETLP